MWGDGKNQWAIDLNLETLVNNNVKHQNLHITNILVMVPFS